MNAPERPAPSGQPKTVEDKIRRVLAAEQLEPDERAPPTIVAWRPRGAELRSR